MVSLKDWKRKLNNKKNNGIRIWVKEKSQKMMRMKMMIEECDRILRFNTSKLLNCNNLLIYFKIIKYKVKINIRNFEKKSKK